MILKGMTINLLNKGAMIIIDHIDEIGEGHNGRPIYYNSNIDIVYHDSDRHFDGVPRILCVSFVYGYWVFCAHEDQMFVLEEAVRHETHNEYVIQ